MDIYLDTEFNEFKGELISLALVAADGREFYEVVPCGNPGPWVAKHVMPVLGKFPIAYAAMQQQLQHWLLQFDRVHIVADWPEDIQHFCEALITGPGLRINTPPLTMEVRRDLDSGRSAAPHNALADARAIRAAALHA